MTGAMTGATLSEEEIEGAADPLANPRHEAFARLVVDGRSNAEAYRSAGYVSASPDAHGARLASSGSVAARITYLRQERAFTIEAASLVDSHRIGQELESVAMANIVDAFEESEDEGKIVTRMLPVKRWPIGLQRALQAVKVKRYVEGNGQNARTVELLEFKLTPKVPALHELRAHQGLLKPKEINHNVRGVIALPVLEVPQPGPTDRVIDAERDGGTPDLAPLVTGPRDAARRALMQTIKGMP